MMQQMDTLNGYRETCEIMIEDSRSAITVCEQIKSQYQQISARAAHMHQDCEKLLHEKDHLERIVQGVGDRLKYFDDMEQFTLELNSGSVNLQGTQFFSNLKKLDDSTRFMAANVRFVRYFTFILLTVVVVLLIVILLLTVGMLLLCANCCYAVVMRCYAVVIVSYPLFFFNNVTITRERVALVSGIKGIFYQV